MDKKKELIKKLAEETIYSAKGHFKSADLRRVLITTTIWLCAILGLLQLLVDGVTLNKILSACCLLGTIGLLIWNEGEGKNYRDRHKQMGELYLSVHKELRDFFFIGDFDNKTILKLSDKVKNLDKKNKPDISFFARKWAQKAIQKFNETDNWYK